MFKRIEAWLTPPEDWEPDNPERKLHWADGRVMLVLFIGLLATLPFVMLVIFRMAYVLAR
jgi:hypothetical protein